MMNGHPLPAYLTGLTEAEVLTSRKLHGPNTQKLQRGNTWWRIITAILKEPMLIILLVIAAIYFALGEYGEAWFMIGAILIVSGMSFYQDNRSRIAIEELQALNAPNSRVIRNGQDMFIPTAEIVPGDLIIAEEGGFINADGIVVYSHDFSVNESTLTGEAQPVFKSETYEDKNVFSGTMVSTGIAVYKAEKTGMQSRLGQLGSSLLQIKEEPSPLQRQIESFVRKMFGIGAIVFVIICIYSYIKHHNLILSLLNGLTLAMSILPEEIPVAFTTFMALGSRRLIREGILVKKTRTVETLGGATIICSDKTGTITENKMSFQGVYSFQDGQFYTQGQNMSEAAKEVITLAMWASEPMPFDPMEKTIHDLYADITLKDQRGEFEMIHEYPLGGTPPMMTHIFENRKKEKIIATKGAPEAIINASKLTAQQKKDIETTIEQFARKGYRILAVGIAEDNHLPFPAQQQQFLFRFLGLIIFVDPPKKNIKSVFDKFYEAGIRVKIISGDNAVTTKAVATEAGLQHTGQVMNGDDLMKLDEAQLSEKVKEVNIFTRMFPEAKLKVIKAYKEDHQVVAMIGDGVNDGPALKAANIGIAMGRKGTEIAKNAADLILLNDDLAKLVDAVAAGRRIYTNLKKAVQYIISIHIPIILTVFLPLILGWVYPNIFTPVHVIFLELIMGPTCSIVYENEPMEKNAMQQPPRPIAYSFLNWRELSLSCIQGLIITAGIMFIYRYAVGMAASEELTRTLVFMTLILSNIFLTLVNRSFYFSVLESFRYRNPLIPVVIILTLIMLIMMLVIPAIRDFFHLTMPSFKLTGMCLLVSAVSVFWFEGWKLFLRMQHRVKAIAA